MQPDISELMTAWYVWGALFLATALMTVIGTHLITRGWKE
ncbi:MAG: hypothetical protein A4E57_03034 [Syntrophorhabdaceae bacterium PtaU1.Bin034]|nr:MAG: hypothetical protein A4E57_03034 [Syntrophorhabdaceae bacterium PtaU1.Bin034]